MKDVAKNQIDTILRETEINLSSFEKSVRPALNSNLSDKTHKVFEIIFEPKTFSVSLFICLVIFYGVFFIDLLSGEQHYPQLILILILLVYPTVRALKFIKNKIR